VFDEVQAMIGPYTTQPAACKAYNPKATVVAQKVADLVHACLPNARVEHVGSTAVPGCDGKGIVDLLIPIVDGEMENMKKLFDRLGFQRQTGQDPFPEDRPMRVGSLEHDGETFLLHVHLVPAESPEVDGMLFARACLRADSELVRAYVARKKEIIKDGVTDSIEYCRIKGEFLKAVFG
jgi:GrpB-like predicted nucleotidyltransferase (UPF0157 family)